VSSGLCAVASVAVCCACLLFTHIVGAGRGLTYAGCSGRQCGIQPVYVGSYGLCVSESMEEAKCACLPCCVAADAILAVKAPGAHPPYDRLRGALLAWTAMDEARTGLLPIPLLSAGCGELDPSWPRDIAPSVAIPTTLATVLQAFGRSEQPLPTSNGANRPLSWVRVVDVLHAMPAGVLFRAVQACFLHVRPVFWCLKKSYLVLREGYPVLL
jgi:hypothetical protein